MLFNSITYAVFLPIVFIFYWMLPHRYRWILLLCASYYFYMSWNVKYVVLIFLITIISYIAAILVENESDCRKKKIVLGISSTICLSLLFFFKYFNFISGSLTDFLKIFSLQIHPVILKVFVPVGISFYTFQALGYVIDVYMGGG